jgi:Flp pilus assembly protein TadD
VQRARFPRHQLAELDAAVARGELSAAIAHARDALAAVRDASAVLVPVVTLLLRRRAFDEARALVEQAAVDAGLAALLLGKIALAAGDAKRAVQHLDAACAIASPYFQARSLRPHALRAAGRAADARAALHEVGRDALYPHRPLATLAEWSWLDGEHARARAEMREAIDAAPPHRRGRLRTRLAEWLAVTGEVAAARAELERAIAEDPGYPRSREVLAAIQ